MARETTVYVLDLNLGEEGLASAHEVLRLAVQRKVALFEKDEIGLVLAGTAGTDNPHYEALGEQYAHITVAHDVLPVKAVGITVLRALSIPPLAEARASDVDLFSALATAVHLLGTRIACRRKVAGETHSILLITAGTAELPAPDDEALDGLVEQCASNDMCARATARRALARPRVHVRARTARAHARTRAARSPCSHSGSTLRRSCARRTRRPSRQRLRCSPRSAAR